MYFKNCDNYILYADVDLNAVPQFYLEKMYANQDYNNTQEGGLSFESGSSVYVLLRNAGGWCTGMYFL